MRLTLALCAAFCLLSRPATAAEPPATQNAVQEASRYCARDGETTEERIERLETALRLARQEARVNAGMRRKGRVTK
jgi:hypothetical protein